MKYGTIRVSSDEQKKQGLSVEAQKNLLLENGVLSENIFIDEAKSGSLKDEDIHFVLNPEEFKLYIKLNKRPSFKKLLEILKPDDEVVFTKWDRISRNVLFMELFLAYCNKKNIKLTPLRDTEEIKMVRFQTLFSQMELEATTSRNEGVFEYLYNKGIYPYRAPYGYIKNNKKNGELMYPNKAEGELIIIPEEANIIKDAFQTAIKTKNTGDKSLYRIFCKKHNVAPIKYYEIIKNKTYLGYTHYKDEYKKSKFVPNIISEEVWEASKE